jgi:hypothetical protein
VWVGHGSVNLRVCLDQCSLGLLRQLAAAHQVQRPDPVARAELISALTERLLQPGYLDQTLQKLAPESRLAIELLAAESGRLRGFVLERRLRAHLPGADETLVRATTDELLRLGLIYRVFQATGPDRGEVFVLFDELLALLPATTLGLDSVAPLLVEPPERTLDCSSSFSLFALASFIRRWRLTSHRAGQDGQLIALSRETADLTVELPGRAARERWTLLAHLGLQRGLFSREEVGLQPTDLLEEWLGLGESAERQLWESYVNAEQWNDLERAGAGQGRFAGRTVDPVGVRASLLELVRSLPFDGWILVDALVELVRERAPDFLREGFEGAGSRLVDLESGEVLGGPDSWERLEGQLVRYVVGGPLYWLGAVEWGAQGECWDRLRLTARGRAWLFGDEVALRDQPEPLRLDEERKVIASERADLRVLWRLEPYLRLERRGPPAEYSLQRTSFAAGQSAGGSLAELRELLEQGASQALPLSFRLALERWGARAGRFRLRPAVLLQAEDPAELDPLLERSELKPLLRERLGPTAAVVAPARANELAEALQRLGQLPELDSALRLMAGRRAYGALVDAETLEALLFCIRLVRALDPKLVEEIPHANRLAQRLEEALGPISAPRLTRRAREVARKLRASLRG